MQRNNASSDAFERARATAQTLQAIPATPLTPHATRAPARAATPQPLESPDPIATAVPNGPVGSTVPTATGTTVPPVGTDLQRSTRTTNNPYSALKPAVSNRPKKAPGGTFDTAGTPGIGTHQSAIGTTTNGSFNFRLPHTLRDTTTG